MFYKPSVEAIDINNMRVAELTAKRYDAYTFKLLGGELFAVDDAGIRNRLVRTVEMIDDLERTVDAPHNPEPLVLASNMLYRKSDVMFGCLDALRRRNVKYSVALMASFDFYGRFMSGEAVSLYYRNFKDVQERYPDVIVPVVSIIMSRQNMRALAAQENTPCMRVFNALYDSGAEFDAQYLYNDAHLQDIKYSEGDLNAFIRILNEKYGKTFKVFKAFDDYHSYKVDRYTVQGGKYYREEDLYSSLDDVNCLICRDYMQCRNSYRSIQYHATDCDVKKLLHGLNVNK